MDRPTDRPDHREVSLPIIGGERKEREGREGGEGEEGLGGEKVMRKEEENGK